MLGLGNYLKKHGFRNRVEIFMEHLNRVSEIAKKYGFEICMWSDMFFKLITGGNYYAKGIKVSEEVKNIINSLNIVFFFILTSFIMFVLK